MTGYLDTEFAESFSVGPGSVSYRRMLNRLSTLGGAEARVFGFGSRLVPVAVRSNQDIIAQLVRQDFYRDDDTRLEDVLDAVRRDSARASTHLIITDGRRGDGGSAIAQYKSVGELARAWAADGMFALAVTTAPFRKVRNDRAGCWTADRAGAADIRCPIYVIAFLPRTAAREVLDVLRAASTRLYVTPSVADTAIVMRVDRTKAGGSQAAALRTAGGRSPADPPRLLLGMPAGQQGNVAVEVRVDADVSRSLARFSADDSLVVRLFQAPLASAPTWDEVRERDLTNAWVKPMPAVVDSARAEISVPVALRTRAQLAPTAYRVEVLSAGVPAWLGDYEATQQGDSTRTFGLSTLFEHLRGRQEPARLFGFYGVVH
jgi:hypothetical protein